MPRLITGLVLVWALLLVGYIAYEVTASTVDVVNAPEVAPEPGPSPEPDPVPAGELYRVGGPVLIPAHLSAR